MLFLKLAAATILGILLMGIWFGLEAVLANAFQKAKLNFLMPLRHLFTAFIPTAAVLLLSNHLYLNLFSFSRGQYWLGSIAIAFIASAIVSIPRKQKTSALNLHEVMAKVLDGILMEIPMRLMMQVFVWYILQLMGAAEAIYAGIIINALIWCSGIMIQNVLSKGKWNSKIWKKLIASFVFSLGAGFLLSASDCILFPMIAHALERAFSSLLGTSRNH